MIRFAAGGSTHVGQARRINQDQLLTADPIFVVADGMGGHSGGEVASAIAVDEMAKTPALMSLDGLVEQVEAANREIVERSRLEPELRGMGTTVVALVALSVDGEDRLGVANVGDSRLYRRGPSRLDQITEDHSLVEALVRDGRLSRQEAANHPQRNVVTRALGIDDRVLVDAWELPAMAGDRFLLCSDGLVNEVAETRIHEVLSVVHDPASAAAQLVAEANEAGGRDNITVVVVDIEDVEHPTSGSTDGAERDDTEVLATVKAIPAHVLHTDETTSEAPDIAGGEPPRDAIGVDRTPRPAPFITWRLGAFIVAVLAVLGILVSSVMAYGRSNYFLAIDEGEVVVFRGRPGGVLWIDPSLEATIDLDPAQLTPNDLELVNDNYGFDSLDEAMRFVDKMTERAEQLAELSESSASSSSVPTTTLDSSSESGAATDP